MKSRSCAIVLNDSNHVLLMHRIKNGNDYWVFPGGSIKGGETPERAVIRELLEETSLTGSGANEVFSQINEGRKEHYFLISTFSGLVKLGSGPEQLRQSGSNFYKPEWVPIQEIEVINLLPTSAKAILLELWRDRKL